MSSQFSFKNICLEIQTQKQGTKDYVLDSWNYQRDKKIKITIQITITEDDQIIYSHDGVILRVESVYHGIKNSIIFKNMEQILYLTWQSQNKFDKKKNGRWFASWNGNTLLNVGGYYQEGLRQGQWYELMKNFGSKAQVFEIGEYYNDLRTYKWIYIYNTKRISSGFYNNQGLKVGKWDELNDKFWGEAQIIYSGEYNMKGKKIGKWDILYCKKGEHQYKFIGGGSYDYFKHQKVGKWVELCEKFEYLNQVTYIGEYDQKGLKRGRWDTWFQEIIGKKDYKLIGGGLYDNLEGEKKIGKWIEMSEGFDYYNQVTYIGEYDQQGLKIGKWDIWFQEACGKKEHKQIGGGSYEYEEGEKKIGMWVEQGNGFWNEAQVIYSGKYDKKGKKVGRWDILYKGEYDLAYQQIGGGLYQKGQLKIKRWIELWDGFWNEAKITYNGEYDLEGIKIGKWKIMYCEKGKKQYQQIGGGSYDSNNLKIGKWAEVFEGFYYRKQVLNIGEYDQKGIKVGIWDIMFQEICGKKGFKQIGGGFYKKGQKIGMWVELDDRFDYYNQVIYKGEYNQKSIKIDRWNIYFKSEYQEEYKQIGGGLYEEGQKVGDWEEISEKFYMKKQIIYKGAYDSKGMKIGIWVVKN